MLAGREIQADLSDAAGRIDNDDGGIIKRGEKGMTTNALALVMVLLPKHATKVTTAAAAVARPMICDVGCARVEALLQDSRRTQSASLQSLGRASCVRGR